MATPAAIEPKGFEANLRDLAFALCTKEDDHPLLEVADDACSRIVALMEKDPGHTVGEDDYREFYRVVQDIIDLLEDLKETDLPTNPSRFSTLDLIRLKRKRRRKKRKLKRELKKEFERAFQAARYKWEDAIILSGRVVSTISTLPSLAMLKPVGSVLEQLGELIKTMHGNKDECAELLHLATRIVADLSGTIQGQSQMLPDAAIVTSHFEPREELKRDLRTFERTLLRIRDYVTNLERESRVKRLRRFVLATAIKEDLASFRKELGDAQLVFVTRNVCAIRIQVHQVHDAVRLLNKPMAHDGELAKVAASFNLVVFL
ncbi:hypothetical protein PM082_014036 [Marasmius tenuissimus]|nr:hypothetical protein PM082_014036 [Marasmius tenuissimus]